LIFLGTLLGSTAMLKRGPLSYQGVQCWNSWLGFRKHVPKSMPSVLTALMSYIFFDKELMSCIVSSWIFHIVGKICNNGNSNVIVPFCDVTLCFAFHRFHYWHSTQQNTISIWLQFLFCLRSPCLSFQFAQFCIYMHIWYMVYFSGFTLMSLRNSAGGLDQLIWDVGLLRGGSSP
jgi:hypothetical protein